MLICVILAGFVSCDKSDTDGETISESENVSESEGTHLYKKQKKYERALELIDDGKCEEAYEILKGLGDYKDSAELLKNFIFIPSLYANGNGSFDDVSTVLFNDDNLPASYITIAPNLVHVNQYTYDSNGNLIKDLDVINEEIWLVIEYIYDEDNKLIERKSTNLSGYNNGNAITREYIYDSQNNLIRETQTSIHGEELYNEYEYDAYGNLTKEVNSMGGKIMLIREYSYDSNGNMLSESYISNLGTKKVYEYTYDSNGKLLEMVGLSDGTRDFVEEYAYDSDGNLKKSHCIYSNGKKRAAEYTYNFRGKLKKEIRIDVNGDKTVYEYEYDLKGNLKKSIKTVDYGTTEITYDKYGNSIMVVYFSANGDVSSAHAEYRMIYVNNADFFVIPEDIDLLMQQISWW